MVGSYTLRFTLALPSSTMNIALVTCADTAELVKDDLVLLDELRARGISAAPLVWDDPAVDWSQVTLAVLRETWDYHHRLEEFLGWLARVERLTTILNPTSLVRWNAHKGYLRDLEQRGIAIVPTMWLAAGTQADFASLIGQTGWDKAVIKPTVSASAFETLLFTAEQAEAAQAHIDRLLPARDLMMQAFLPAVQAYGERSLMFVDGVFTHSVRRPEPFMNDGIDYTSRPAEAAAEEIAFATDVLRALPEMPLYARVDIAPSNDDQLFLMELELIEPSLFFQFSSRAAGLMADALERRLSS